MEGVIDKCIIPTDKIHSLGMQVPDGFGMTLVYVRFVCIFSGK